MTVESSEITFAVTSGIGYEKQTKMLVESIHEQMPESNVVSFIPEKAKSKLSAEHVDFFENFTDLYVGETPRPEYPLTNLTRSFILACEKYDSKFYVQLDSDTLLLNKLQLPERTNKKIFAKPTNLGSHYWASKDSTDEWVDIYCHFGRQLPEKRIKGTFDKRQGYPVWNAGVIATKDPNFPKIWLETTEEIIDSGILGDDYFYAEQLSLSVLGTNKYEIEPLSIKQNYAQEYIFVPSDVQILHYGDPDFLPLFVATPTTYKMINKRYDGGTPSTLTLLARILNIARGRSRRYISRRNRLKFENICSDLLEVFPKTIQNTLKSIYG